MLTGATLCQEGQLFRPNDSKAGSDMLLDVSLLKSLPLSQHCNYFVTETEEDVPLALWVITAEH